MGDFIIKKTSSSAEFQEDLYMRQDHLLTALDEGYIQEDYNKRMKLKIVECITILNGYINYLGKAAQ